MGKLNTYLLMISTLAQKMREDERGEGPPSWIFITVAVIGMAVVVAAALNGFISEQIGNLGG